MNETVVDPELESFVKKDLGINKNRVEVAGDELSDDSSDSEDDKKITKATKTSIARAFCNTDLTDARPAKLMNMLTKMEGMTEKQAKTFLDALRLTESINVSDDLVTTIIKISTSITVNPKRKDVIEKIINDKHVKRSVSLMCADLFDLIGNVAGVVVYVLYSLLSWNHDGETDNANLTLPINDSVSVSDGKNNTVNKTT